MKKIEFVEGARHWFLWWSTWFQAAGMGLLAYLQGVPDAAISFWSSLPPDLKAYVPQNVAYYFVIALIAAGVFVKTVKQRKLDAIIERERAAQASRLGQAPEREPGVSGEGVSDGRGTAG